MNRNTGMSFGIDPSPLVKPADKRSTPIIQPQLDDFELRDEFFIKLHYPSLNPKMRQPMREEFRDKCFPHFRYQLAVLLNLIISFFSLITIGNLIIIALGAATTAVCIVYDLRIDLPISLLSVGVIFPISFSIGYSNDRRERALLDLASLKSSIISLYHLHREWGSHFDRNFAAEFQNLMQVLVEDIIVYISHKDGKARLYRIYQAFDKISVLLENLRTEEDWVKSVITRAYQFQRFLIHDFERIRVIHDFRTVSTLRSYSLFFITTFPIIFAPYFAHLSYKHGLWAGIYVSIVSNLMLVTLSSIQEGLEDPFDQIGMDDINLQLLNEVHQHMF